MLLLAELLRNSSCSITDTQGGAMSWTVDTSRWGITGGCRAWGLRGGSQLAQGSRTEAF